MTITQRQSFILHCMNLALLLCVGAIALYDRSLAAQLLALVGITWLSVLLIVPRIMYNPRLSRWHGDLLDIAKQSKWLGIWTFVWLTFHGALVLVVHYGTNLTDIFSPNSSIILAEIAWVILLLLALTSNKWSYDHLTFWKHLNMAIWAVPPLLFTHAILVSPTFAKDNPALWLIPALLALSIIAGYTTHFVKEKKKFDIWRLGMLTAGLAVSILVLLLFPRA